MSVPPGKSVLTLYHRLKCLVPESQPSALLVLSFVYDNIKALASLQHEIVAHRLNRNKILLRNKILKRWH